MTETPFLERGGVLLLLMVQDMMRWLKRLRDFGKGVLFSKNIDAYLYKQDNNYKLIRLIAALCVLISHSYSLSAGVSDPFAEWFEETLGQIAVYVFFSISGFLVTRSYINTKNLFLFIEKRLLRIYPALIICVILCVLLGSFFTTVPLIDYFNDRRVYRFLFYNSTLYNVQYELPGVFLHNPYPNVVNGSLWVLPHLIKLYIITVILGLSTILQRRWVFNISCITALSLFVFYPEVVFHHNEKLKPTFAYFLGMFFYINRSTVPVNGVGAILLCILASIFLFHKEHFYWVFFQIALAYGLIWLALVPTNIFRYFNKFGDYSYGLYIYAFPVQQMLAASIKNINLIQMLLYSSLLTFSFAWLSWHLIEKHRLRFRGVLFLYLQKRGKIIFDKYFSGEEK